MPDRTDAYTVGLFQDLLKSKQKAPEIIISGAVTI